MRRVRRALVIAVTLCWLMPVAAQNLEAELQRAIQKEVTTGDLAAAIQAYQEIATRAAATNQREVAAKALLRKAETHEQIGEVAAAREARVRASSIASSRAEAQGVSAGGRQASFTSVWSGSNVDFSGSVSPDGRYISYVDWQNKGNLAIRDLTTNTDRVLTKEGDGGDTFADTSAISRDGRQIAYTWFRGSVSGVRVMPLLSRDATPRDLSDNPEIRGASPYDWSPDGRWLAVQMRRGDATMIGLMSIADGSFRQLKSSAWTRRASRLALSPDGRFIAFDLGNEDGRTRHVSILAVDGSAPQQDVVAHASLNEIVGWSSDGGHVLFMSDRRGSRDLWAVPVTEGRARGDARLVKSDVGRAFIGMSRTGALYFGVSLGQSDVTVASVDVATGRRLAEATKPIASFVGTNHHPDWSPDGRHLAYVSVRPHLRLLGVLNLETGQTRELVLTTMSYFQLPSWAPDGRSLAVQGQDQQGRQGIFRVDAETGAVASIALREVAGLQTPRWSPDGLTIYYRKGAQTELIARDITSGLERPLRSGLCGTAPEQWRGMASPSRDGRFVATLCLDDRLPGEASVIVVPLDGGPVRELGRLRPYVNVDVAFSADGQSVIAMKSVKKHEDGTHAAELWAYPVGGGAPRRLDVLIPNASGGSPIKVHPDGRRIAYVEGPSALEVWKLEHTLP